MKKSILLSLIGFLVLPSFAFADFTTNLKYGSKGDSVRELQEFLTDEGVYSGPITGNFFALTRTAVKAFQTKYNLSSDGYFGAMSRNKANERLNIAESDTAEQAETGTVAQVQVSDNQKMLDELKRLTDVQNALNAQMQSQTQLQQQIVQNTTKTPTVPEIVNPTPDTYEMIVGVVKDNTRNSEGNLTYTDDTLRVWTNLGSQNGSITLKVNKNGKPIELTNYVIEQTSNIPNSEQYPQSEKTQIVIQKGVMKVTDNVISNGIQNNISYTLVTGLPNNINRNSSMGNYWVKFSIPALNLEKIVPVIIEVKN